MPSAATLNNGTVKGVNDLKPYYSEFVRHCLRYYVKIGNVPTVLLDIGKREPPDGFNIVKLDSGAVGRMGAEHLLGLNLKTYAYVGFMRTAVWDEERRTAFASAIHKAGCDYKEFCHARNLTPAARHARLYSWIKALPKPCGLMACNDAVGEEILNICSQLGIHVPNDIAVLGADNDMRLCENTVPTLASIDSGGYGYRADSGRPDDR